MVTFIMFIATLVWVSMVISYLAEDIKNEVMFGASLLFIVTFISYMVYMSQ